MGEAGGEGAETAVRGRGEEYRSPRHPLRGSGCAEALPQVVNLTSCPSSAPVPLDSGRSPLSCLPASMASPAALGPRRLALLPLPLDGDRTPQSLHGGGHQLCL